MDMALTEAQSRLAVSMDRHIKQSLASGQGGEGLWVSMYDHMGAFKQLLETCSPDDLVRRCQHDEGVGVATF
jgi:hypothetical protein